MELNNADTKILYELPLYFFSVITQKLIVIAFLFLVITLKHIKIAQNLAMEEDFSEDIKKLIPFCSCLYFTESYTKEHAAEILRYGLNAFRTICICVTLLSAFIMTTNLSNSTCTCKCLWQKDLVPTALLGAESRVSCEIITCLLSLISVVLRFPIAAQWLSPDFFLSLELSDHLRQDLQQSLMLNSHHELISLYFFFCIALCICFCMTVNFKISLCFSDLQIKSLRRKYPRICGVSSALITNNFVLKNKSL